MPGDTPGIHGGKKEQKMGDRCSEVAEVILEDVRVPAANLLGKEGDRFKIAMETLDVTRPGIAISVSNKV